MNNWNGIVSLLIACVELVFLINLLVFAEKNKLNWIIILIVFLLFGYQTIEFLICGIGLTNSFMAYLAFVDITFLPPLNLFFVLTLINYKHKLTPLIFLPALSFVIYYFFVIDEFKSVQCTVLYASYNYPLGDLYGFFYYSPILFSVILLIKKIASANQREFPISPKYLLYGHLSLIIPVVVGFTLLFLGYSGLINSIESILCKFAFLYCLVLVYFALSNKKNNA